MTSKNGSQGFAPPLITETMAQLLLEQRHWREAITIYRELGRKNPEKAAVYQKKITEIKRFFAPESKSGPERCAEQARLRRQIAHLQRLLGHVAQLGRS